LSIILRQKRKRGINRECLYGEHTKSKKNLFIYVTKELLIEERGHERMNRRI